ncbi:MAG: hypothetical protein C0498_02025 [Anaerolinea sp.]|jgi:hypothetical protein|nr:hypothetical protein [Anaerolinea sp.]
MGFLMDLVAGESREILLAISLDDWAGLDDPGRFDAHIALGGAMDPTWLDRFSEAVRDVTGSDEPIDLIDARRELNGPGDIGERTVERVDPAWITGIARIADRDVDAIAGRWIELVEEEVGDLPREEKPWIRQLAGQLVEFARKADLSPAVILAWSL